MGQVRVVTIPMVQPNDANAETVGDYLKALLSGVWEYEESFDGKRPFGNSSWKGEVYAALIRSGVVAGKFDEDGYLEDLDVEEADNLIRGAIRDLH